MTGASRRLAAVLLLAACAGASRSADAADLPPYRTALVVRWGQGAGSDALRADFVEAAAATLATGCLSGIAVHDREQPEGGEELTLTVVLSDAADEIRYDDSIATALMPGEPTQELRRVARFTMKVHARLTVSGSETVLAEKRFAVHTVRRPMFIGEDPRETVRAQAITDGVRALTKAVGCRTAKLDRKLRQALTARGSTPGSR